MTKDNKIKVGIAGLGRSGWDIHAHLLRQAPEKYQVVAVADKIPARLDQAAGEFGCRTFEDFDDLIADPEVELVVVAVPSYLHTEYSMRAMKAGKDVVTEKPMATSLVDAEATFKCAKDTGRLYAIFQNKRYSPDFRKVKEVIDSGVLGKVVQIRIAYHGFKRRWDWQTLKEFGGGSLNNTCPHPIDHALVLMDGKTPRVNCERARMLTLGDADDHVRISLSAEGAPSVDIEVTDGVAFPQPHWHVVGTRGGLTGSPRHLDWKYVRQQEFTPREADPKSTPDRSYNREELNWHTDSWDVNSETGPGEVQYYLDLYQTIRHGEAPPIDPEIVHTQMVVMEECRKQAPV